MKNLNQYDKFRQPHPIIGDLGDETCGLFMFPHNGLIFMCLVSSDKWEHVSTSLWKTKGKKGVRVKRCPTWDEMCWVKDRFWEKDECVVQYHPPSDKYVDLYKYCLHLWKPADIELPMPPEFMV